jgi:hypothetical protein
VIAQCGHYHDVKWELFKYKPKVSQCSVGEPSVLLYYLDDTASTFAASMPTEST